MNIVQIKEIIGLEIHESVKRNLILNVIATDKEAIPYILSILNSERETSEKLILDTNLELSRALVLIEDPKVQKLKTRIGPKFVRDKIHEHYLNWRDRIRCCFQIEGLP